jgi:hypothetical protein
MEIVITMIEPTRKVKDQSMFVEEKWMPLYGYL